MDVFSTLCSICCDTANFLRNVTNDRDTMKQFNVMLHTFFGETYIERDMPVYLCNDCCEQLIRFNNFKELFVKNMILMRKLYLNIKLQMQGNQNDAAGTEVESIKRESTDVSSASCEEFDGNVEEIFIKEEKPEVDFNENEDSHFENIENEMSSTNSLSQSTSMIPPDAALISRKFTNYSNNSSNSDEENIGNDNKATINDEISTRASIPENIEDEVKIKPEEDADLNFETTNISETTNVDVADREVKIESGDKIPMEKGSDCKICGKTLRDASSLVKHMRIHTKDKPYLCKLCGKNFTQSSSLTVHMRLHTQEKPYACDACDKRFNESAKLAVHIRTHTKDKPYTCKTCMKSFGDSSNLRKHKRIHSKQKPYICKICNKTFADSSCVRIHLRTHTKERPYECKECGKTFSQSTTLNKHMRIHTKEKPYKCPVCEKRFNQSGNVTIHMYTHTKEKRYVCKLCEKAFTQAASLSRHMRMHGKPQPDQKSPK